MDPLPHLFFQLLNWFTHSGLVTPIQGQHRRVDSRESGRETGEGRERRRDRGERDGEGETGGEGRRRRDKYSSTTGHFKIRPVLICPCLSHQKISKEPRYTLTDMKRDSLEPVGFKCIQVLKFLFATFSISHPF